MLFIFWGIGNMGVSQMKAMGLQMTLASLEEEKEKLRHLLVCRIKGILCYHLVFGFLLQ
jgi:hypothetical protein